MLARVVGHQAPELLAAKRWRKADSYGWRSVAEAEARVDKSHMWMYY
jgi:hypothetical protein